MSQAEELQKKGLEFEEQGDYGKAIESFYQALQLEPENLQLWSLFAHVFRFVQFSNYDDRLKKTLLDCLEQPIENHQDIAYAGFNLLKLMPAFQHLFGIVEAGDKEKVQGLIRSGEIFKILSDPLFLSLLRKTISTDPKVEKLLTILRRELLEVFFNHKLSIEQEGVESFIETLCMQCFMNQYVYIGSKFENEMVDTLSNNVDWKFFETLDKAKKIRIALIGCYRPLRDLVKLFTLNHDAGKDFNFLLEKQVLEPLAMSKLEIPKACEIKDDISLKVKAQYESNPYPSWSNIAKTESQTIAEFLRKTFPQIEINSLHFSENPNIFIAGCGTGQHVFNTANQFKNAHVLGMDLSHASLVYAQYKANELQIPNVEFIQGDILEFNPKKKFDLIECTGVLHHMQDPFAGWKVLRGLLKPQGIMQIGLYSEIGRQDVVAARDFIAQQGYGMEDEAIRRCRQDLLNLPESELAKNVTHSLDFYTLSGCRDLLFHVQEHRFNLLQIEKILKDLSLQFIGFELRDKNIKKQYLSQFPDDPNGISLEHWHQFEQKNPHTFAGMYQFWVQG
jgi:SAM-dependent methyltransferase